MPLSPPVSRQLRHRRAIRAEAYERADGLWDVEACLTDEKPRDVVLASGVRPNGQPIHELWLRITIDRKLNVVDAEASSDWVPYPGLCQASNPAYRALIGLNLFHNFRRDAARLLAGTAGCTHLTELCALLPTAAIQAFAGDVWNTNDDTPGEAASSGTEQSRSKDSTDEHSSWDAATRCVSTARRCNSFIRAGMAALRIQRIARHRQATGQPARQVRAATRPA